MGEEAKAEGNCGGGGGCGELAEAEADGARFSSSRLNSEPPPPLPLGPSSLLGPLVELGLVVLYTEDDEEEDKVPPEDLSRWLSSKAAAEEKGE